MSGHVDRAASAMDPEAFADRKPQRPSAELQWAVRRKIATDHALALNAAGLLSTPEREAAVAAKALREAAKDTLYGHDAVGLRRRADWVEREGGASGADT